MKLFRYLAIAAVSVLAALVLGSCTKEKEGAGDATIGFSETEYVFKETAGIVKIPVVFTGEPKYYPISFDVKVEAEGEFEVEELTHFVQTEGLKYKGDPEAPVYVEFEVRDNDVINDSRYLNITIANVNGAEITANGSVRVEIADNDNNPYERLWGKWTFSGTGTQGAVNFDFDIHGGFTQDEEADNADKVLVCYGWLGYQWSEDNTPVWYLDYDAENKKLYLQNETVMTTDVDFGSAGVCDVHVYKAVLEGEQLTYTSAERLEGTWSDDCNTITFEQNAGIYPAVISNGESLGHWSAALNVTLTRKK